MKLIDTTKQIVTNKSVRSTVLLILTLIVVLAINSLLPVFEGNTHYTEDAVNMTYAEYKELYSENNNYQLTWTSSQSVEAYKKEYIKLHPDIPYEEHHLIEPPDSFQVEVYTKFFFNYSFWYLKTIIHIISTVLVFYSVFNFLLVRKKKTDKKYLDLNDQVNTLVDTKLDPVTFEPWVEHQFNYPRKVQQHLSNVKYKLHKLDRHTNYKIRILYKQNPDDDRCEKYKHHKEELLYYSSQEYIDTYVHDIRIPGYRHIYPTFITGGYNVIGHAIDSYSLLKSDSRRLGEDSIRKVLVATVLTVLIAVLLTLTVVTSLDKPWYWVLINIITTLLPLFIQIPMAFDYCEKYMEEQVMTNLISRRNIAFLYLAYMEKEAANNATTNTDTNRPKNTDDAS
jgi:hypothetical protein